MPPQHPQKTELHYWPRLSRFFGLSPGELSKLPRAVLRVYIDALPGLQAEEQLAAMAVADFPHLDKNDRRRMHSRLVRELEDYEEPVVNPLTDLGVLAGLGIAAVKAD